MVLGLASAGLCQGLCWRRLRPVLLVGPGCVSCRLGVCCQDVVTVQLLLRRCRLGQRFAAPLVGSLQDPLRKQQQD